MENAMNSAPFRNDAPGASFGSRIRMSVFGTSHGPAVGALLDGVPAGEEIDLFALDAFLRRRAPGQSALTTARKEEDLPEILSGITDGKTNGAPLAVLIRNTDTRSKDYEKTRFVPRPGHADYPAFVKYGGENDPRGGGQFSARLTAPLCAAGGILLQILARRGICIGAHIAEIAGIQDTPFDPVTVSPSVFQELGAAYAAGGGPLAGLCLDPEAGDRMAAAILEAKNDLDSVGGVVECAVTGLPAGLGSPLYGSLEGVISQAVFGIPAVKGIEFGEGFGAARLRGSENNDPYTFAEGSARTVQSVRTASNHHGGILGGLTSGMPVIFRAAFKPTPSIGKPQKSVDLRALNETELVISGRHDPCVVPRAVPCVIAAAAAAIADVVL